MKLVYKNIVRVYRYEANGVTYSWTAILYDPSVSEGVRTFVNRKNGVSVVRKYPLDALPYHVQKFIANHKETLTQTWDEGKPLEVRKYTIK